MNEPAAVTVDDVKRRDARRLRIALGCFAAVVLFCCLPCVFTGAYFRARGERLLHVETPPRPDPSTLADPLWRRVAIARRDATSTTCLDVTSTLLETLGEETTEVRDAAIAELRARIDALATEGMLASCHAASMMSCDAHRFAAFRAEVVLLGQPVYDLARRDADAYVRYLPSSNRCRELSDRVGVDTSATIEPMSRSRVRALVPRTCRRFGCTLADLAEF